MRFIFLLIISCQVHSGILCAQGKIYTPARGSAERTTQMKLLHQEFDPKFYQQQIVFTVDDKSYKSDGKWAFASVMVYRKGGSPVDFNRSSYKDEWEEGFMDSNGIVALFKKGKSGWSLEAHIDFPTDVPYGCWWKEYNAPKKIFPYTEQAASCDELLKENKQG